MITTHSQRAIATATATALLFAAFATTASAGEGDAIVAANLSIDGLTTLTLPAGDGVRDSTSLEIYSDAATAGTVVIRESGGGDVVATLDGFEITDPAVPATVSVPVQGLTAGTYEVVATPSIGGEPVLTDLTVGSGEPISVSLGLSKSVIYGWSGTPVRTSVATVSATDETGEKVPFTGTVTAKVGGKTYAPSIKSTTSAPALFTFGSSKFGYGTGSVVATVWGPSETPYSSAAAALTVATTAVSSLTLSAGSSAVYPYKDYYLDTVKLTLTPKTTNPTTFKSTGSVKIIRNGKTVKSWTLTSSKAWTATWDGKVGGKIVPGTYTVKATLKGPQGYTKTATKTITVRSSKLVSKTKTVTYKSGAIYKTYVPLDELGLSECFIGEVKADDFYCDAYGDLGTIGLIAYGSVSVPSDIQSAMKYGKVTARATMNVYYLNYAEAAWSMDFNDEDTSHIRMLSKGANYSSTLAVPTGNKRIYFSAALFDDASLGTDTITMRYTYKTLVSS